jgi:putative ABC transport system substrate-binding protein
MRRREFVTLLGGAAAAWPLAVRAQQRERVRRVGVFMPGVADDPEFQARNAAFLQGLGELGWSVGRNLRIDYRWGRGDTERYRAYAAELVALAPDVILALGTSTVTALLRTSRSVPIVFANVIDPVGGGLVASLARPGGNATGFISFEFSMGGKWVELLKEIAPRVTRIAVVRDATIVSQVGMFGAIQNAANSLGVELSPIDMSNTGEAERTVAAFARLPNGGLIASAGAQVLMNRDLIVALAARHRLPAVYAYGSHVAAGGLLSYGIDNSDQFRRAAGYVDRILKGEKPADLPVQTPTKFELVLNLKTAKTLGLTVPPSLLVRADEVIE